jgi:hypothetical protein
VDVPASTSAPVGVVVPALAPLRHLGEDHLTDAVVVFERLVAHVAEQFLEGDRVRVRPVDLSVPVMLDDLVGRDRVRDLLENGVDRTEVDALYPVRVVVGIDHTHVTSLRVKHLSGTINRT